METLSAALTLCGVEFDAECEFSFDTFDVPPDYVPYGEGMVAMGGGVAICDLDPERVTPSESIYKAALETLIQRGRPNNAKARKHARYLARKISQMLANTPAFDLIDENEFTERAERSL